MLLRRILIRKQRADWNYLFVPAQQVALGKLLPHYCGAVQFANYKGGNYLLMSTSPYRNAATDGKDLGADMSKIQSVTATVY